MTNLKLKSLVAAAVLLSSASAFAVQLTIVTDAMYSSSGSFYNKIKSGSATTFGYWDWDGTTLTMQGSLSSIQSVGPTPLLTDNTTNMVINTAAGTTTASSYTCTEGLFLGGVGAHGCWNLSLTDFVLDSSAAYNVGGDANCINVTVGGNDVLGGGPRGLGTPSAVPCDQGGAMAYADWTIALDNTGAAGGFLILSSNGAAQGCAGGTTKNAACADTTYLKLQAIPVPAAVWLFGSGLGLLGLARRRIGASA